MEDPVDEGDVTLDRELRMLREAIDLVAAGVSRRVVVASLRYGDLGADLAALDARRAGVQLTRLRSGRAGRSDIAVEPVSAVEPAAKPR
jgi:hypothetical protein